MTLIGLGCAAFGSAFQEFLHWHTARRQLSTPEYRRLTSSVGYWVLVLGMIVGSAIGTSIWFDGEVQHPRTFMLVGAAFPLLFKKAAGAVVSDETTLGESSVRNYFRSA